MQDEEPSQYDYLTNPQAWARIRFQVRSWPNPWRHWWNPWAPERIIVNLYRRMPNGPHVWVGRWKNKIEIESAEEFDE